MSAPLNLTFLLMTNLLAIPDSARKKTGLFKSSTRPGNLVHEPLPPSAGAPESGTGALTRPGNGQLARTIVRSSVFGREAVFIRRRLFAYEHLKET